MASAPFDKLKRNADAPSTSSEARAERRMSIDRCPWFRPLRMRDAAHPGDLWTRLAPECPGAAATRTTPINTLIRKDCRANATVRRSASQLRDPHRRRVAIAGGRQPKLCFGGSPHRAGKSAERGSPHRAEKDSHAAAAAPAQAEEGSSPPA